MEHFQHSGSGAHGRVAITNGRALVTIDRADFHWEMDGVIPAHISAKMRQVHALLAETHGWPKGGRWLRVPDERGG